jgi:hypothetical protein
MKEQGHGGGGVAKHKKWQRLSDRKRKQIVADYVGCGVLAQVARKHGVSVRAVKNALAADAQSLEKLAEKKQQNTLDMLEYLDANSDMAIAFVGVCMGELLKEGRLEKARPSEITTAMGTVIDKFTGARQMKDSANAKLDALIEGINNAAKPEAEGVLERALPPLEHKARRDEDGKDLP